MNNIKTSETLFRLGIVSNPMCFTCFVLLPPALFKMLQKVTKTHAALTVIFANAGVPISYLNVTNRMDRLTLIDDASYMQVLNTD